MEEVPALVPSARVEGNTVVACWRFSVQDAPLSFAAAVLDQASGLALEVAEGGALTVERRDGIGIVTWAVKVVLASPPAGTIELRPTDGTAVELELSPSGEGMLEARRESDPVASLRALLRQQADQGHDVLEAIHHSVDPAELRIRVEEASMAGEEAAWPLDAVFRRKVDKAALDAFVAAYGLPAIATEEAEDTKFQSKEDWKGYVFADGAIEFVRGDPLLPPLWPTFDDPPAALTHEVREAELAADIELALFADNGNGLYAARQIARQIVASRLPYAFHLGDVYYGGSEREHREFFEEPLAEMLERTELFMLTGNHEMFSRGRHYQEFVQGKAARHPARQRQNGEMFRLRWRNPSGGPGFQILGVDTMFVGWDERRLRLKDRADERVVEVVDRWLGEGSNDLTILMTTNQPWTRGKRQLRPLYEDLKGTIAGRADLWFWGNVHYAALFEPWVFSDAGSPRRHLVGACIGHGGYPFYTQTEVGELPEGVRCRWLETKSRFWPDANIRPDVGANGWARLKLARQPDRWDVGLTFVDWVGRERLRVSLVQQDGESIQLREVSESNAEVVGGPLAWLPVEEVGS